jgi:hypothetical protein
MKIRRYFLHRTKIPNIHHYFQEKNGLDESTIKLNKYALLQCIANQMLLSLFFRCDYGLGFMVMVCVPTLGHVTSDTTCRT